jgi:hypothetical protein
MATPISIERNLLVFIIWACLGFLGLGIILEGFSRDTWVISAMGVTLIVLAFSAHIVVNGVFDTGFTRGETALGMGCYGLLGLTFIFGAFTGKLSMSDLYSGLILFGVLALGLIVYLATRHGLRGAFSQFHIKSINTETDPNEGRK